jgi:hypothetical protein
VHLVASNEALPFSRNRAGLTVKLPDGLAGEAAIALRIRGAQAV